MVDLPARALGRLRTVVGSFMLAWRYKLSLLGAIESDGECWLAEEGCGEQGKVRYVSTTHNIHCRLASKLLDVVCCTWQALHITQ